MSCRESGKKSSHSRPPLFKGRLAKGYRAFVENDIGDWEEIPLPAKLMGVHNGGWEFHGEASPGYLAIAEQTWKDAIIIGW